MAYCPANPGWERQRKSEKKNYRSDHFLPDPKQRIEKKKQKNSKNQKTPIWLLFKARTSRERPKSAKIKIIISIISNPTPNREFQKKQQKNSEN